MLGALIALAACSACSPTTESPSSNGDVEPSKTRESTKPLPTGVSSVEEVTTDDKYAWFVGKCIETTRPLYFYKNRARAALLSEDPPKPDLAGYVHRTREDFEPETFEPGEHEHNSRPAVSFVEAGTRFQIDEVFVLHHRLDGPSLTFVGHVETNEGRAVRADFEWLMGAAARTTESDPLDLIRDDWDFFSRDSRETEPDLRFCEEIPELAGTPMDPSQKSE